MCWIHVPTPLIFMTYNLQVREPSRRGPSRLMARPSLRSAWDKSSARRYRRTVTGTCSFTNRRLPTCASTITSLAVLASVCTRGGTRYPRTRNTISWKSSAVSRRGPPGHPMLVSLYVPFPHFYFSYVTPIVSGRLLALFSLSLLLPPSLSLSLPLFFFYYFLLR